MTLQERLDKIEQGLIIVAGEIRRYTLVGHLSDEATLDKLGETVDHVLEAKKALGLTSNLKKVE